MTFVVASATAEAAKRPVLHLKPQLFTFNLLMCIQCSRTSEQQKVAGSSWKQLEAAGSSKKQQQEVAGISRKKQVLKKKLFEIV